MHFLESEAGNASFACIFMPWIMYGKYNVDVFCMHMYNTIFDISIYEVFALQLAY